MLVALGVLVGIQEFTANKEDQQALIAELSQNIKDLSSTSTAGADSQRTADKAKNTETIADAKAAQEAAKQAIAVLKDFYAKSAQATVLATGRVSFAVPL